ncbi:MAG TPA: hypothetical protein DCM54_02390 [Gammaproteobacteria bacterium]|nr:hypothetical protein [Gammaproteobacteria bacterium]
MFVRIYALAVCFASMMCIAISSGVALYDVVQYTAPKLTVDVYPYPMRADVIGVSPLYENPAIGSVKQRMQPTEAQIKAQQEQQMAMAIERERAGVVYAASTGHY